LADRVPPLGGGRRGADRQVQAHLPRPLMPARTPGADVETTADAASVQVAAPPKGGGSRSQVAIGGVTGEVAARQKSLTIGAVCKALAQEFPDISISKIRYLE